MRALLLCISIFLLGAASSRAQTPPLWQSGIDSVVTLSSPRAADLNGDGVKDIVVGGGRDGISSNQGIMALDGATGTLLWQRPCRDEVFGSALFQDANGDGTPDAYIVGREAQLLCINGANGNLIWQFYPHAAPPRDSGWFNFYNPQIIHDVDNDGVQDLLVGNGGDHAAPAWDPNRPIGKILVVSGADGGILAQAQVPDGAETYCSPIVADLRNDGAKWILYGTGGEHFPGSFWACPLDSLLQGQSLAASVPLRTSASYGFIAPASLHRTAGGGFDIIIQAFDGTISKIKGSNFAPVWQYQIPGTQSSAAPVIGNFTGSGVPDVFAVLYKGQVSAYTDYYQVMLDGATGQPVFLDSLGSLHFASANACDLNNDGRDEAIVSLNYHENGRFVHRLQSIDFVNQQVTNLAPERAGVNLACTPLITDLDGNNMLDLVYIVKRDSLNPMGWKGFDVHRIASNLPLPNAGIAWGSYMGNKADGLYSYGLSDCGPGSVIAFPSLMQPSCNGHSDGAIGLTLVNPGMTHTFVWSNGAVSQNLSGLTAGTYSVVATNSMGCYETLNITLNNPYTISFGALVPPTCPGMSNGNANVASTGCVCMFSTCTFVWDNGNATAYNATAHDGYNYVTITHTSGCVVVDSVLLHSPPISIDAQIDHICPGESEGGIDLTNTGSFAINQYAWSTGDTGASLSQQPAGSYWVALIDSRGCKDTFYLDIENVQTEFHLLSIDAAHVLCHGDSTGSIAVSDAALSSPLQALLWNDGSTDYLLDRLTAGSYSVTFTDANGCSEEQSIEVLQPAEPLQAVLWTVETSGNGDVHVSVSGGTPPYSIQWNDPMQQTGTSALNIPPFSFYTASVTDANGCILVDSIYLKAYHSVNNLPAEQFEVYPNPTSGPVFLSAAWLQLPYTLCDALGRVLLQGQIREQTLDLSDLPAGLYLLQTRHQEQNLSLKLIKK